jgi:hypothetical protein
MGARTRIHLAAAILAVASTAAAADPPGTGILSGNAFVDAGGGSIAGSGFTEFSGGGEAIFSHIVGVGGELGFVSRHSSFGYGSADVSVHFLPHFAGKVDPFIVGGYTYGSDLLAGASGGNFGAGLNYWMTHHIGVRAEFRDIIFAGSSSRVNGWAIRGGVVFR